VPPEVVTVAVPVFPPLQSTSVAEVVNEAGELTVTVTDAVPGHPAEVVPDTV